MSHTSFLGIPVDGDISPSGEPRREQYPQSQLEPYVQALLDDPTVEEFGWRQYTPYFNDGEPCVFHAGGLWVRTVADAESKRGSDEDNEDEDEDEDEYENLQVWGSFHPTLKGASLATAQALDSALDNRHFDDVLLNLFGDHANVIVKRTGISVEFYEHD